MCENLFFLPAALKKKKKLICFHRFAGLGPLRVPNVPSQFKNFTGTTVHTANWDKTVDFKDKNVAVVGSGAR